MRTSTLLNQLFFSVLLLFGYYGHAQQFPNSSIDANYPGLSSGCATAVNPVLTCDDVIVDTAVSFAYLEDSRLTNLCTTACSNSLRLARQNIVKACTAATDVIVDGLTTYPATYVLDRLLWSYTPTCRKDATSGTFCHSTLRKWAMANTTLTKDQECSDCMLGTTQAELISPFQYENAAAAELASRASSCGKPTFTAPQPASYGAPKATPTVSAVPTLRSKDCPDRYQVRAGDDCHSVSQAHNVSTFGLLYWNSLSLGCTNFPQAGKQICLPTPCAIYTVQKGDNCFDIIKRVAPDYSIRQLRSWNLNINNVCGNLADMVGDQICVGPPALLASVAPSQPVGTPTATPVTTPVPMPTNAAPGSNPKCGLWYTTISGDICGTISGQYSISLKDFYFLNPIINSQCSNLAAETAYCVRPVGDITTYPGYDGGTGTTGACDPPFPAATCYQDPSALPDVPFLEANATFTRPSNSSIPTASRTVIRTTHTPSPTAPGSRTGCLAYAEYVKIGNATLEKSINSCSSVASYYGVTIAQLLEWNTSLKAASCVLSPRYAYCAGVEGAVGTSAPDASEGPTATPSSRASTATPIPSRTVSGGPPGPTQTGIVANCNKWAVQSGTVYCADMAAANGIALDKFYQWNPAVKGDCSGMQPNYAYCVGVSS